MAKAYGYISRQSDYTNEEMMGKLVPNDPRAAANRYGTMCLAHSAAAEFVQRFRMEPCAYELWEAAAPRSPRAMACVR